MGLHTDWPEIKTISSAAFRSSLHFSICSISPDGEPHATPIGSLILDRPAYGFYFEHFTQGLSRNIQSNSRVCILAVNSSRWFWLSSLLRGKFLRHPALRLYGTVGELRDATAQEQQRWQKRVAILKHTKGHRQLWRAMHRVREIHFDRVDVVSLGTMTREL